jgi:uncharacterized integral membrane protein
MALPLVTKWETEDVAWGSWVQGHWIIIIIIIIIIKNYKNIRWIYSSSHHKALLTKIMFFLVGYGL